MSYRARRLSHATTVEPYDWGVTPSAAPPPSLSPGPPPSPTRSPDDVSRLASVERDAFIKGYAQGERAGAEAAAARGQAMLRRLGQTLEELAALRADMIRRTERQIVQLALAIAKRIVSREITLDRGLLVGMAHVAIQRLGEHASATIRLNPEDYATVTGTQAAANAGGHISVVADPLVSRGGCLVQSDFGFMDVTPETQFDELARTLLEETEPAVVVPVAMTQFEGAPVE